MFLQINRIGISLNCTLVDQWKKLMGVLFTSRYNVYFIYLYSFRFTFTLFDQFSRCYQVLLLLDVLSAQSELFPRLDKGLVKDHKIGGKP